jgi:hypothetical protein
MLANVSRAANEEQGNLDACQMLCTVDPRLTSRIERETKES